jgi:hypothetical protein
MKCRNVFSIAVLTVVLALSLPAHAAEPAEKAAKQTTYATAEDAAAGLADAVRSEDFNALLAVVGPSSKSWIQSGDRVADLAVLQQFLGLYATKHEIIPDGNDKATLAVGADSWPFPAPLVKQGDRWRFDAEAGKEEVLNRRIGRDELDTIQTLLAIVDAQREYATVDRDRNGLHEYAKRFFSSSGKQDGLYWSTSEAEPPSPLGPLVAKAAAKGYVRSGEPPEPYNGYLFRILTAQGPDAPGGAYDYLFRDKLIGGFAVVAWPAKYGNSGIVTFVVNHDGVVYQKDFGDVTPARVARITRFNPDRTWTRAQSPSD